MNALLERIVADCKPYTAQGHVATYIPELANVDADQLGIFVSTEDGKESITTKQTPTLFLLLSSKRPTTMV